MTRFFLYFCLLILLPCRILAGNFEDTVQELVLEKTGSDLSLEIKFDSKAKLEQLETNSDAIKSVSLTFFSPETKSFKVLAVLDHDKEIELFGKFEAFFEVPVSTRMIKIGEELSLGDITTVKVKRLKAGQSAVKDLSTLVGMQAKYHIPAGNIIKIIDLKKPAVIKENDPVTLLYKSHGITLKTIGIALSAGAIGEKIRVKNEKTGIVVFGEIMDKNVVKVSSSDGK